jgi:IS30 family transposase
LTLQDRVEIAVGVGEGLSFAQIGERIGRPRQTVSAEVGRHGGRVGYRPGPAQDVADRAAGRGRATWVQTRPGLWAKVVELLAEKWSPEQISSWLRAQYPDDPYWWVSHESIYQAVFVQAKGSLKAELAACLRTGRARRKPRGRVPQGSQQLIPDLVLISQRPPEVEDRAIPGHWEGDLITGKGNRSFVATLVERSSRFGKLIKIDTKTAPHVAARIAAELQTLPDHLARSLTWDQGREMVDHRSITLAADIAVYFCDPRSPWQRGTNENWNGLVRQYLPKGTDLSVHTQDQLDQIAVSLNSRPRKTLGWRTPAEVFNEHVTATT